MPKWFTQASWCQPRMRLRFITGVALTMLLFQGRPPKNIKNTAVARLFHAFFMHFSRLFQHKWQPRPRWLSLMRECSARHNESCLPASAFDDFCSTITADILQGYRRDASLRVCNPCSRLSWHIQGLGYNIYKVYMLYILFLTSAWIKKNIWSLDFFWRFGKSSLYGWCQASAVACCV